MIVADWLGDAIDASLAPVVDEVPDGWLTINQIRDHLMKSRGIGEEWARKLARDVARGKECRKLRVAKGQSGTYPLKHYKLK